MRPVGLACSSQHAPELETMQGAAYNSDPARFPPPVRAGNSASGVTALPAPLAAFLHEFLGERAVARETVKKAAPAFRRYDGSF
jgi:hypothetical protein